MSTDEQPSLVGSDDKIDPSLFPVPKTMTHVLEMRAAKLRTGGVAMNETGDDIVSAWEGLTNAYKAPEAEELHSALAPVASNGSVIGLATERVASALEEFAETVRGIQADWRSLKAEANTFLAEIEDDDKWNKPDGFFTTTSTHGDENNRLVGEAQKLIAAFEEAERSCAGKINIGITGRTEFLSGEEAQGKPLGPNAFVYDTVNLNTDIPSTWGDPVKTDQFWYQDVGDAVWDFGVGAVEGTGAMLGLHSSEGWLAQSWGDSLKEYHWDNLTSAASLVGMYDAENDSLGWSGLGSAGEAWKELAHSVVPWEEWGDRPGYVIGTALLNVGSMVGGAVLTATGVGAVVGVPLMAWRGAAILDGMGGSGRGGGSGMDLPVLPDMPTFGGAGAPVVNVDTSQFSPSRAADVSASLERLNASTGGGGTGSSNSGEPSSRGGGRSGQPIPAQKDQDVDPRGGDLGRADRATSPESSSRDGDSYDGSKKSDDRKPPNWAGGPGDSVDAKPNDRGSEKQPAYSGGRGDGDTLTEARKNPTGSPAQADATKIGAPGSGTRSGNEIPDNQTGDRGADLQDNKNNVRNQSEKGPAAHTDGSDGSNAKDNKKSEAEFSEKPKQKNPIPPAALGPDSSDMPSSLDSEKSNGSNDEHAIPDEKSVNGTGENRPALVQNKFGDLIEFGSWDSSGRWIDPNGLAHLGKPDTLRDARAYDRIRNAEGDTEVISERTGVRKDVLDRIKEHIFLKDHDAAVGPNQVNSGRFEPMDHIASWWEKAQSGKIPQMEEASFRKWMAHESVESKLMEWGMPYRSPDERAWKWDQEENEWFPNPNGSYYGAHDISPGEGRGDAFRHYKEEWEKPESRLNEDLSNSEDVAREIFRKFARNDES